MFVYNEPYIILLYKEVFFKGDIKLLYDKYYKKNTLSITLLTKIKRTLKCLTNIIFYTLVLITYIIQYIFTIKIKLNCLFVFM